MNAFGAFPIQKPRLWPNRHRKRLAYGMRAKGYHFRYEGEPLAKSYKHERHKRKVIAIDEEGKILRAFPSVDECAKYLGVIVAAVTAALEKRTPKLDAKDIG